eukprot:4647851-Pyramimonas_sp.AAC.1
MELAFSAKDSATSPGRASRAGAATRGMCPTGWARASAQPPAATLTRATPWQGDPPRTNRTRKWGPRARRTRNDSAEMERTPPSST